MCQNIYQSKCGGCQESPSRPMLASSHPLPSKNLPPDSFFGQISFLHSLKSFGKFPSGNVLDAPVLKSSQSTFPRETPTTQVCFHWQHLCNIKAKNEILEGFFFGQQIWFLLTNSCLCHGLASWPPLIVAAISPQDTFLPTFDFASL